MMRSVKCVLVGEENVDKKELLLKLIGGVFNSQEDASAPPSPAPVRQTPISNVRFQVIHNDSDDEREVASKAEAENIDCDEWHGMVTVDGKQYFLEVYDTRSAPAYDALRPDLYPATDVFIVCFSVALPKTKQRVIDKWLPEIQQSQPVTPFLLVGTHIDWRDLWDESQEKPVYTADGAQLAERLGAVKYLECSMTAERGSIRHVFEEAVRVSSMHPMELSRQLPGFEQTGTTLLHRAARANHVPSVLSLVDTMDINIRDKAGCTPLDSALAAGSLTAVRTLLASGCELSTQTEGWKRRCEFWGSGGAKERLEGEKLSDFSRQLAFLSSSLDLRGSWHLLLIGHPGAEVANFLGDTASNLHLSSLSIVNCEGLCVFDFSHFSPTLESLTITNCELAAGVLDSIFFFEDLVSLSLVKTNLVRMPDGLEKLKRLQRLRVSDNKLRRLPNSIGRLQRLRFLHCDSNLLETIPDPVGCLGNLEALDVTQNKLEKLSASLGLLGRLRSLKFARNRLKFPPAHVLNRGRDAVLEFLGEFLDEPVSNRQVKLMVVGGQGVGKSTLVKAMEHKKDWRVTSVETPQITSGVQVSSMGLMELQLNVFDMLGDPAFLAVHHLFLSSQGLYQAVFNMSEYAVSKSALSIAQLASLELWLQLIHSQAPSSHVLIIGTHSNDPRIDDDLRTRIREDVELMVGKYRQTHRRQFESETVPQCVLCEGRNLCDTTSSRFYVQESPAPASAADGPSPCIPHIVGYYEVSCQQQFPKSLRTSKNLSMQKMKVGLGTCAQVLLSSKVGARIPQKCLYVRSRVHELRETEAELKKRPIITLGRIREIARGCGIMDDFKIKGLVRYFHSQGQFLWFEDVPSLSEHVFLDPSWVADQLNPFFTAPCDVIKDGVLPSSALGTIWPAASAGDRQFLLALLRKLGICFPLSTLEDLVPSRLPIGRPGRDVWPCCPADARQISCAFKLNFLPPALFSEVTVMVNMRSLPSPDPEPVYFRHCAVFSTTTKARQGCPFHFQGNEHNPLLEEQSEPHRVFLGVIPHERMLQVRVRGSAPCCVLPDILTAVKIVVDSRYPGIKYSRLFVCPGCELRGVESPVFIGQLKDQGSHSCQNGHEVGAKEDIMAGILPKFAPSTTQPIMEKPECGPGASHLLEDSCCPRLFAVFPIGFQTPPLISWLKVLSSIPEGYAAYFICECPGFWHLVKSPGFRIPRPKEFFRMYGARVCKLFKVKFLLPSDDSLSISPQFPTKIVLGDAKQNFAVTHDVKELLGHYYEQFPELEDTWASFLPDDLSYLRSHEGLNRRELCRALEIAPEWGRLGLTSVEILSPSMNRHLAKSPHSLDHIFTTREKSNYALRFWMISCLQSNVSIEK